MFSDRELCVGPDPNKFQNVGIQFPVDQHEVGSQMAVPAVFELTFHSMVDVANWERHVPRQQFECVEKGLVKMTAVHATLHTFKISLELSGPFDRADSLVPGHSRPDSSVVAIEFGERILRTAEFRDVTPARRLDGRDGGAVRGQRPAVRPGARFVLPSD